MFDLYPNKIHKKRKIKFADRKEIEPQEIFLDSLAQRKIEKDNFPERKIELPLSRKCFYGLLLFSFFVFFGLFTKSFQLQIIKGEEFYKKAEKNKFAFSQIQASRGIIYDKDLNQLVFNQPVFNLVVFKSEFQEQETKDVLKKIADSINLNYSEIIEKIKESNSEEVIVVSNINYNDLIVLEIITRDLPGVELKKEVARYYQDDNIFSHVIGYLGKISSQEMEVFGNNYSISDYIGKSGLEKSYEEVLRVIPGKIRTERDVFGNLKSEELISMAQSGKSLVLSIDANLQRKIYAVLENNLPEIGSKNAAVIATNPQTGEILSLISFPGFDNNIFSLNDSAGIENLFNDPDKSLFNRVTSGVYPVGSIIKPFMAIAALEEKIVSPEKEFYSAGSITIPNPWDPSRPAVYADWMAHGWVNLRRAIAVSSNVYFYIIGGGYEDQKGLGANLIKKYLNLFGWGSETGIDLPDEKKGFIPDPEWKEKEKEDIWRIGDSYNLSIGQGDMLITPIQVIYAFNAVANNGKLMKPMIVKKILDNQKNIIEIKNPEIIKSDFVSTTNIEEARKGMRDAVLYGSAAILNDLPVEAAAKTGTAQISKADYYHNWVTVFAPYDNPEIVLTIIIEEVKGVRAAALPVAKEVLQWYFSQTK